MSTRGRLPSPDCTRIVVLGLLCRHGPQHGYELRKRIVDQHLNDISNVQLGSIYAALKKLATEGLVVQRGHSRSGSRPTRTTFAITKLGKKELHSLIAKGFRDAQQPERPVDLALHFSGLLDQREAVELLQQRLDALDDFGALIDRSERTTEHEDPAVLEIVRDMADHFRRINRAELAWTKRVLDNARSGAYRTGREELSR